MSDSVDSGDIYELNYKISLDVYIYEPSPVGAAARLQHFFQSRSVHLVRNSLGVCVCGEDSICMEVRGCKKL